MTGSDQLQQLLQEIETNSRNASSLIESREESSLTRRPANDRWSAIECVQHLTRSTELYFPILPPIISAAREKKLTGEGPFKMDFKGRLLKWFLEPPYRTKSKTLPSLEIETSGDPKSVLAEFLSSQEELKSLVGSSAGLRLDKLMVNSPFSEKMRYNLYACFSVITAHQRRHLWQAEQTLMTLAK